MVSMQETDRTSAPAWPRHGSPLGRCAPTRPTQSFHANSPLRHRSAADRAGSSPDLEWALWRTEPTRRRRVGEISCVDRVLCWWLRASSWLPYVYVQARQYVRTDSQPIEAS